MGLCPQPDLSRAMKPARTLTGRRAKSPAHANHYPRFVSYHDVACTTRISASFFPRVLMAAIMNFWVHSGPGQTFFSILPLLCRVHCIPAGTLQQSQKHVRLLHEHILSVRKSVTKCRLWQAQGNMVKRACKMAQKAPGGTDIICSVSTEKQQESARKETRPGLGGRNR